MSFPR